MTTNTPPILVVDDDDGTNNQTVNRLSEMLQNIEEKVAVNENPRTPDAPKEKAGTVIHHSPPLVFPSLVRDNCGTFGVVKAAEIVGSVWNLQGLGYEPEHVVDALVVSIGAACCIFRSTRARLAPALPPKRELVTFLGLEILGDPSFNTLK
jgi:hypothetical protein